MPDLADKLTAEQHGALGEQDRSLYVKAEDDSFSLHPAIVAERTKLTSKNNELKTEKQKAAEKAAAFEALGLSAEDLASVVQKHKEAEASKLTEKEREEAKIKSLTTSHETQLNQLKGQHQERETFLTRELRRTLIDSTAALAIEKAGVIEGGVEALLPHVVALMDMLEEGEGDERRVLTRIVDGSKQPRYAGAEFMSVDQLVEEFKKKPGFMGLFKASGAGGSGAPANQNNRNTTRTNSSDLSATDKIAAGLANRK